jgi:hypothetical protein
LQLLDAHVAAAALDDALRARIVDAIYRTERHAEATVDAFLEHDREAAEEIIFDPIDRIDLAGTCVIARTSSDAAFVDVVMSGLVRHPNLSGPRYFSQERWLEMSPTR